MFALLAIGVPGALLHPFLGLVIYYGFATLYPHFLWEHALPPGVRWSLYIALATLAGFVLHGFARGAAGARWPVEKKLLLVLAGLTVLSFVDAVDPAVASRQLDDYLKVFLMCFVACGLLDSRYRLHVLAVVLVLTLGWLAIDFNQRYLLMGQKNYLQHGFATLDNNGVAALMAIGLPFCMFLFGQEKRWYLKWPPLGIMVLMLHVVLFSMSRAAMLACLIVVPFLLLRQRPRWLGVGLTVFMLSVGVYLAGPEVRRRFLSIEQYETDVSSQGRIAAWKISVDVMRDYPLLGVGPDCFRCVAGDYDKTLTNRTMHNNFLQAAVDMGVPAGLINAAIPIICFIQLGRLRRRSRGDPFLVDLAGCLQAALLAYVLVGSFASIGTIELPYIALVMGIGLQNVAAMERQHAAAPLAVEPARRPWRPLEGLKPATT